MKNKKRELLFSITKKDLIVQTFRAGGKGGQHQNKTDSGVRITHPESGAVGECREYRSQLMSKREALRRLSKHPKFIIWVNQKVWEITNKRTIEEEVERQMRPDKLKIEVKKDGKWIDVE